MIIASFQGCDCRSNVVVGLDSSHLGVDFDIGKWHHYIFSHALDSAITWVDGNFAKRVWKGNHENCTFAGTTATPIDWFYTSAASGEFDIDEVLIVDGVGVTSPDDAFSVLTAGIDAPIFSGKVVKYHFTFNSNADKAVDSSGGSGGLSFAGSDGLDFWWSASDSTCTFSNRCLTDNPCGPFQCKWRDRPNEYACLHDGVPGVEFRACDLV